MDSEKKHIPFDVPDAYFEQLPSKISTKASQRQKRGSILPFIIRKPALMTVPLVLILLFIALFAPPWGTQQVNEQNIEMALMQVSDEEVVAYLLDIGITESELIEHLEVHSQTQELLSEMPEITVDELEGMIDTYDIETLF